MKSVKLFHYISILLFGFLQGTFANLHAIPPDEIARKMDEHRLISNHFVMTIRIEGFTNHRSQGVTVMKGYVNNGKMTMLAFLEPLKMKGRRIVINDNDMRIIIPNVKNPIRITPSQRLMAGISYADIAKVSYGNDYNANVSGEEQIAGLNPDGTESEPNQCLILELTAKETGTNYNKIMVWVDKRNFLPVKADFFALSGKKMITTFYTAPKEWNGKIIITKMFLFDQINTTKHFSVEYLDIQATQSDYRFENLPE